MLLPRTDNVSTPAFAIDSMAINTPVIQSWTDCMGIPCGSTELRTCLQQTIDKCNAEIIAANNRVLQCEMRQTSREVKFDGGLLALLALISLFVFVGLILCCCWMNDISQRKPIGHSSRQKQEIETIIGAYMEEQERRHATHVSRSA